MQHGICTLSIVPARKEPSGASEMVTQLLFGEAYTVEENTGDWLRIKTAADDYVCWISAKQHSPLSDAAFKALKKERPVCTSELVSLIQQGERNFPLTIGATLPFFKEQQSRLDAFSFKFEGQTVFCDEKKTASEILDTAFLFLNAPYLWGGRSPFGIDCSGFTQLVFKLNGYRLPRDAYQQVESGHPLRFVEEAEAGDLAFFDNEEGRIVHVGILLNHEQIIHASGCVRIDKLDHYGIYNHDKKGYSHTLRVIKRIL